MRVIAIMSGGDWADAGVTHVIPIKDNYDLEEEREKYYAWFNEIYLPAYDADSKTSKHMTFPEWLIDRKIVRAATIYEVIEIWAS